jgi:virulence-associated protein VagC
MTDVIIDINMVPKTIFSRAKTKKVKIHEENGSFVLTPIMEKIKNLLIV